MANELSSGCVEVNKLSDDEKEEGEISLEDVSSSDEGQSYKYPPRILGNCCPYCLSAQTCATWCRSLIAYKNNYKRDAGLQGKENRANQYFIKDSELYFSNTGSLAVKSNFHKTLQKKNNKDEIPINDDAIDTSLQNMEESLSGLVPISSDSDMELVGLDLPNLQKKKANHRQHVRNNSLKKSSNKTRKKRRKKSPDTLSLSPSPVDIALLVKESIHNLEPKKEFSRSKPPRCRYSTLRKHNHLPSSKAHSPKTSATAKKRSRSPQHSSLSRKTAPLLRSRKSPSLSLQSTKKSPSLTPLNSSRELPSESSSSRGTVTKLLKKVRRLEPFSSKSRDKTSTSLKDKLSNIIKIDKKEPVSEEVPSKKSQPIELAETVKDDFQIKQVSKEKNDKESVEKENELTKTQNKETVVSVSDSKETSLEDKDVVVLHEVVPETKLTEVAQKSKEDKTETLRSPSPSLVPIAPSTISTTQLNTPVAKISSPTPPPSPLSLSPPSSPTPSQKLPNFCMDDNDEDLQLRMIALRSAVLKKHRTRMQCGRGLKKKRQQEEQNSSKSPVPQMESPFGSSFLEDFPLLAEVCNSTSPLSFKNDIYSTEDMELDSDIELDKEIAAIDLLCSTSENIVDNPLFLHNKMNAIATDPLTSEQNHTDINLNSPSKPTETSIFKPYSHRVSSDLKIRGQQERRPSRRISNSLDDSTFEIASQESRPYSPTDVTIYDPELPGVHSSNEPANVNDNNADNGMVPLQPPPLPPLSILAADESLMLGCPTSSLMNSFVETAPPIAPPCPPPPPLVGSFPAVHQPMNPLLVPPSLFAYAAPTTTMTSPSTSNMSVAIAIAATTSASAVIPVTASATAPTTITSMMTPNNTSVIMGSGCTATMGATTASIVESTSNMLDNFGETDLDGSPLVPMEKSNPHVTWPYYNQPMYHLQNSAPNIGMQPKLDRARPTPMEQRMFLQPDSMIGNSFRPIALSESLKANALFKPMKVQAIGKKSVTTQPAAAFNGFIDGENEDRTRTNQKQLVKEESKDKNISRNKERMRRRVSRTPEISLESRRKRKRAATPRNFKDTRRRKETAIPSIENKTQSKSRRSRSRSRSSSNRNICDTTTENEKKEAEKKKSKENTVTSEDEKRRSSVDEETEETLREILLASLAKRAKKREEAQFSKAQTVLLETSISTPSNLNLKKSNDSAVNNQINSAITNPSTAFESIVPEKITNEVVTTQSTAVNSSSEPSSLTKTMTTVATTVSTLSIVENTATTISSKEQLLSKIGRKRNLIPASTKVVNNAKRYQNSLAHRKKLNAIAHRSLFKVNNKNTQALRLASPVLRNSPTEQQKFIINLNEDTESESETEEKKSTPLVTRPVLKIPTSDFEKSVDQFLKNVRLQQEASAASKSVSRAATNPSKSVENRPPSSELKVLKNSLLQSNVNSNTADNSNIVDSVSDTVNTIATTALSTLNKTTDSITTAVPSSCITHVTTSSDAVAKTTTINTTIVPATVTNIMSTLPSDTLTHTTTSTDTITTPAISRKEGIISKLPKALVAEIKRLLSTPQAVKHLPLQQQEEYRRLKKQLIERERLKLKKSKEVIASIGTRSTTIPSVTSAIAITSTASTLTATSAISTITTTSTLSTITTTSSAIHISNIPATSATSASSTSALPITTPTTSLIDSNSIKNVANTATTLLSTSSSTSITTVSAISSKETAALPSIKCKSVTQSNEILNNLTTTTTTTTNSVSKQRVEAPTITTNQATLDTSTKVTHSVGNFSQQKNPNGITAVSTTNLATKSNIANTKILSTAKNTSSLRSSSNFDNLSKQQAELLDKMNSALNNQKKQISVVAHKVSSLRILTKDQINQKTSQLQKIMSDSKKSIYMDDLNKHHKDILTDTTEHEKPGFNEFRSEKEKNVTLSQNANKNSSRRLFIETLSAEKSKLNWQDFKQLVNNEVESLYNLSMEEKNNLLLEAEEKLVNKRHSVLDDITEMSSNLRQWEIEKNIQNNLTIEIKNLREQLRIAEEKLKKQKQKLNTIQPKVSMYHEKINNGRKECFRLSKICNGLGQQIAGPTYKVPTACAELLHNRIKKVAEHSQQLRNKKIPNNQSNKNCLTKTKNNSKFNKSAITNVKNNKKQNDSNCNSNESIMVNNINIDDNTLKNISTESENRLISNCNENSTLIAKDNDTRVEIMSTLSLQNHCNITNGNGFPINNINEDVINTTSMVKDISKLQSENHVLEHNEQNIIFNENSNHSVKNNNSSADPSSENFIMNEDNVNSNEICSHNIVSTVHNPVTVKTENVLNEFNIINAISVVQNNNQEVMDCEMQSNVENSDLNLNVTKEYEKSSSLTNIENTVVLMNNMNTSDQHSVLITDVDYTDLHQENVLNNENEQLTNTNVNLNSNKENQIVNNNFENLNETIENISDVILESEKQTLHVDEACSDTLETKNIVFTSDNLNNSEFQKLDNLIVTPIINLKTEFKNNDTDTSNAECTILFEEIPLSKLENSVHIPNKVAKATIANKKRKFVKRPSKRIMGSETLPQCHKGLQKKAVQPYESILKHLQTPRFGSSKTDGILCPYELMGTCNDGDCQFTHLSTSHCQ